MSLMLPYSTQVPAVESITVMLLSMPQAMPTLPRMTTVSA